MAKMKKDLLTLNDLNKKELLDIIDNAIKLKKNKEKYYDILKNKNLAMLFQKPSTRTRVSFEAAMTQLGGHAIFLDWRTTQLAKASLEDEIKCISRYVDIIMARVFGHDIIETIAKASSVPVINGLSDSHHPCQIIADLMTIKEKFGKFEGLKLAYIGDGNNVCNSLILGCLKIGMEIIVSTPRNYEPAIIKKILTHNPYEAVKGADIVYTDTWVSMGQEKETKKRLKIFKPYQLNKNLLKNSKAKIMHCLPAYRGYEITDEILDSKQSIVFEQAENRLHAQKAVILKLLSKL